MKRYLIPPWTLGVLLILLLFAPTLATAEKIPVLLKDVNTAMTGAAPANLVAFKGALFFVINDGLHGRELWKMDGPGAIPGLLKDIRPGQAGSNPDLLTVVGNTLYFSADDGQGTALWKSDGTVAGTIIVKRLAIQQLFSLGGVLYLVVPGDGSYYLWRSDGTAAGTVKLVDGIDATCYPAASMVYYTKTEIDQVGTAITGVYVTLYAYDPVGNTSRSLGYLVFNPNDGSVGHSYWDNVLTTVGNQAFYTLTQYPPCGYPVTYSIMRTDGTSAGTVNIKCLTKFAGPSQLAAAGNTLFFTIDSTDPNGDELWKTDGTVAGTAKVATVSATMLHGFGNRLLFLGADPAHGRELWISDGTAAGTALLKDITPGPTSTTLANMTDAGGKAFFTVTAADGGASLWVIDGTAAGTKMVVDFPRGYTDPCLFTAVGSTLYFMACNPALGWVLWSTDGTPAGTRTTYLDGTFDVDSSPAPLGILGGRLLFSATDGAHGQELFATDGTLDGTVLIRDINPGAAGSNIAPPATCSLNQLSWLAPNPPAVCGGRLYFSAMDPTHGQELWTSDGTMTGTSMVRDIDGGYSSSPNNLTVWNGRLIFNAGAYTWGSDGTSTGTQSLNRRNQSGLVWPAMIPYHGKLFFSGLIYSYTYFGYKLSEALFATDGTPAGTKCVFTTPQTSSGSYDYCPLMGMVNDRLILAPRCAVYSAGGNGYNSELWSSDGTTTGTVRLDSLYVTCRQTPGRYDGFPTNPTLLNGVLFMSREDDAHGRELWRTEGTTATTRLVLDLNPGPGAANPDQLTALGDRLIFTATDSVTGTELWATQGTPQTTTLLGDLRPGAAGSNPNVLGTLGANLLFSADDGTHGRELWLTDGTPAGTRLLKDINPNGDSTPTLALVSGGVLYFTADDGVHGREIWRTDGTAAGTVLVQDIFPGPLSSQPCNFMAFGSDVFFSANDGVHGAEPWLLTDQRASVQPARWRGYE